MSTQPVDREAARRPNGEFGTQNHTESGIVPAPEPEHSRPGLRTPMTVARRLPGAPRFVAAAHWTAHRLCPVGNGAAHPAHAFYVGVDDFGDDIGTVTCNGWFDCVPDDNPYPELQRCVVCDEPMV